MTVAEMIACFDAAVEKVGKQTTQQSSAKDLIKPMLEETPLKLPFQKPRQDLVQKER